mgnify:CR=1 FL=1
MADVFVAIIANDYAALRRFQRNCSLATYLTVIARRVIVRKLASAQPHSRSSNGMESLAQQHDESIARYENVEEVRAVGWKTSDDRCIDWDSGHSIEAIVVWELGFVVSRRPRVCNDR